MIVVTNGACSSLAEPDPQMNVSISIVKLAFELRQKGIGLIYLIWSR